MLPSPRGARDKLGFREFAYRFANFSIGRTRVVIENHKTSSPAIQTNVRLGPLLPPSPDDVLLLIEVSDTTLEMDTMIKLPRYAASGIPEVWIVNLVDDRIEVYREPRKLPDGTAIYQKRTDLARGNVLAPQAFPSLEIAVDEVLI